MTFAPWEYLTSRSIATNFPDLFHPTWVASLVLLVVLLVLYNVRTRALHKHPPYAEMWEWLWWTGLITFSLLIIEALFVFDFFLVLVTAIIGIGTLVWIRFRRFPPILAPTRRGSRASATTRSRSSPTRRPRSASAAPAGAADRSAAGAEPGPRDAGRGLG